MDLGVREEVSYVCYLCLNDFWIAGFEEGYVYSEDECRIIYSYITWLMLGISRSVCESVVEMPQKRERKKKKRFWTMFEIAHFVKGLRLLWTPNLELAPGL